MKGECKNASGCSDEIFDADWTACDVLFLPFPTKLTMPILMSINKSTTSANKCSKRNGGKQQMTANAPEARNFWAIIEGGQFHGPKVRQTVVRTEK